MSKLYFIFFFLILASVGLAQGTIERQVIGTTGNSSSNGNISVSSTVGETVVKTISNGNLKITQGFQQPQWIEIIALNLKFYTGITPNGDGINDFWYIDGIEQYPNNSIIIFGRTGIIVWQGENYDNTSVFFEGKTSKGADLPTGTYFFKMIIEGESPQKGWIDLTK